MHVAYEGIYLPENSYPGSKCDSQTQTTRLSDTRSRVPISERSCCETAVESQGLVYLMRVDKQGGGRDMMRLNLRCKCVCVVCGK